MVGREVPSSRSQDAAWFLDALAPGSPAHIVCRAYRISGELDPGALRAAWRAVLERHEVLRTVLAAGAGRPAPEIRAVDELEASFVDVQAAAPEEFFATWAEQPFAVDRGPLARLAWTRLGPADHGVVVAAHHAVADEESMSILLDELATGYAAMVAGRPVRDALPEPPVQYADYARRQRALDHGGLRKWWNQALTPAPRPSALPADRPRPAALPGPGGVVRFRWDGPFGDRLATLADAEGVSPPAILLAAFQVLLWRYGDEDRVSVGVPVPVRPRPEFARLVGPCANPLVVCTDVAAADTFRDLARAVASRAGEAFAHAELPFADVVRAANLPRDPGRLPGYDVLFDVRDRSGAELTIRGAAVWEQPAIGGALFADLALTVDEVKPSVGGVLRYRADLFDHATAERLLEQLRVLLGAGLAEPGTPIGDLPMEQVGRTRAAVLAADHITAAAVPTRPVHELVREHAETRPDADAVAWAGGYLSYRDLERRASAVAGVLSGLGPRGRAVAVRVGPGPDQYTALAGVLAAGAHLVWFGTGDVGERGQAVLQDLRPLCLLVGGDAADDALVRWYRDEAGGRVVDVTALDGAGDAAAAGPTAALDERAYIAYTSGSTGKPKGIAQSHAALVQFVSWLASRFRMGPGARVAQWVAPDHDPALAEVFAALTSGATLCPPPARIRGNPDKLATWLAEERITHIQLVPSFAKELLRAIAGRPPADRPASLGHLLLMGEALPEELVNDARAVLPGARLVNLYGPTETVAATWHEVTGPVAGPVPIGGPIPGRQVLVLDERDRPCPAGVTGNIVIRSPYITPGYTGARSADRSAFRPLPRLPEFGMAGGACYRTGDLGRRRPDGVLEFRGRRDFQVKLAGNRVELTEIEAALAAHDSVAECAVVALTDSDGLAARLVIHVVPRRAQPGKPAAGPQVWRGVLRRRFGVLLRLPAMFNVLDTPLPRTLAGKVDRRRLPESRAAAEEAPPQSAAEREMAAIWSELLAGARIGAEDTFFTAGGHSLLLPRLAEAVRARFGVEVPLGELLAGPTLTGLSARVEETRTASRRTTPLPKR